MPSLLLARTPTRSLSERKLHPMYPPSPIWIHTLFPTLLLAHALFASHLEGACSGVIRQCGLRARRFLRLGSFLFPRLSRTCRRRDGLPQTRRFKACGNRCPRRVTQANLKTCQLLLLHRRLAQNPPSAVGRQRRRGAGAEVLPVRFGKREGGCRLRRNSGHGVAILQSRVRSTTLPLTPPQQPHRLLDRRLAQETVLLAKNLHSRLARTPGGRRLTTGRRCAPPRQL